MNARIRIRASHLALVAAGIIAGSTSVAVATGELPGTRQQLHDSKAQQIGRTPAPQGPPSGRVWREQRLGSGWAALRGRPDVAHTSTDK